MGHSCSGATLFGDQDGAAPGKRLHACPASRRLPGDARRLKGLGLGGGKRNDGCQRQHGRDDCECPLHRLRTRSFTA